MSNQTNILQEVAATIGEQPITFTIDISPRNRWHQWLQDNRYTQKYFPRKKEYSIRPVTTGNLLRISGIMSGVAIPDDPKESLAKAANSLLKEDGEKIVQALAYAIHNRESEPPRQIIRDLKWHLSAGELLYLALIVNKQLGHKSFMTTTVILSGANILDSEKKESATAGQTGPQVPGKPSAA